MKLEIWKVSMRHKALCSEGQYEAPGTMAAGSHGHYQFLHLLICLHLQILHEQVQHLGEGHQFLLHISHSTEFEGGARQMCVSVHPHGFQFVSALNHTQLSYLTADLVNIMLL